MIGDDRLNKIGAHRAIAIHKQHGSNRIILQQLSPTAFQKNQQHCYEYQHHQISSPHPHFNGQKITAVSSHLLNTNRVQLEAQFQRVTQNTNQALLLSSSGISQETLNQSVGSSRANSLPRPLSPTSSLASDKHDAGDPHVSRICHFIHSFLDLFCTFCEEFIAHDK